MSWTCTGIADGTLDCKSARYLKVSLLQDLLTRLLERKPARRLGMLQGQANDVKNHPWFAGIDWDSLAARKLMAPRTPKDDAQKRLKDLQVHPFPFCDHALPFHRVGRVHLFSRESLWECL